MYLHFGVGCHSVAICDLLWLGVLVMREHVKVWDDGTGKIGKGAVGKVSH